MKGIRKEKKYKIKLHKNNSSNKIYVHIYIY